MYLSRFHFVLRLALAIGLSASLRAENIPADPHVRWEKEITTLEAKDQANPTAKGSIVFVGSSSIKKWTTLTEDFPHHRVLNHGFGGSQLEDSVYFADRIVLADEPRMIFLYAGANDISAKKTPEHVFEEFQAFVAKIRAKQPTTPIAFISIAGNPSRWSQVEDVKKANQLVADYIKTQPNLIYIDVFSKMLGEDGQPKPDIFVADRLHMNAAGYKIWTDIIGPYLPTADR